MNNLDAVIQELRRQDMTPEQRTVAGMKVMMTGFALAFDGLAAAIPAEVSVAAPTATAETAPTPAPAKSEKKGRAGAKKAAPAAAAPEPAPAPTADTTTPMLPSQAAYQNMSPEDITGNFMVDAMKEKRDELVGRMVEPAPALKKLLTSFGVAQLKDVPEEKRADFLTELWKL